MYYLKNTIFLDLTKNQKAALFSFIKSLVKKHTDLGTDEILELFIEDEQYYYEQNNPHFEWIIEEFEKDKFLKELKTLIKETKKQLDIKTAQKEAQKPYIEKQKAFAKEQRKKAAEFKMSKEQATKKQIYYYNKLCDKYKLKKEETTGLSKLDLKNLIGKILDEHQQKLEEIGLDKKLYE